MRWHGLAALVVVLAAACGSGGPSEEEIQAAEEAAVLAEQARADDAYSPALFDSISWAADSLALNRGYTVYTFSCLQCHGPQGGGVPDLMNEGKRLEPPNFVDPSWPLGENHEALRRAIYTGTTQGMPHWGLQGLKPRDADAVAWYIQQVLRRGVDPGTES